MASVASTVVSCASLGLQLIFNKLRDAAAKRLSERDVADQKIGKLISRELNDIKSKLEAQSRASLLASIEFLEGGVLYLYHFFEQLESKERTDDSEERKKVKDSSSIAQVFDAKVASAASQRLEVSSGRMEALLSRLGDVGLDGLSPEALYNLKECKERFKDSRRKATEAYSDESLSPSDRVLALKIRVIATILENVDTVTVSVAEECKLCVEKLNSLPQVNKALERVGGLGKVKNWFLNADEERSELISNVAEVNFVVWKYECLCRGRTVPVHDLDTFTQRKLPHPISLSGEYCKMLDLGNKERSGSNGNRLIRASDIAVTSEGNIVICDVNAGKVKVFSRDGDFMFSFGAPPEMKLTPLRIAIDKTSDKMYVSHMSHASDMMNNNLIIAYNASGEYLHTFNEADSLLSDFYKSVAVDSHGNLLVLTRTKDRCASVTILVYAFKNKGSEMYAETAMEQHVGPCCSMTTTDDGRIIVTNPSIHTIHVSNEDGHFITQIKVKGSDGPFNVAYNSHLKHIVVNTVMDDNIDMLEVYTSEGSYVCSVQLIKELQSVSTVHHYCLAVTPDGSVAVLNKGTGILVCMSISGGSRKCIKRGMWRKP